LLCRIVILFGSEFRKCLRINAETSFEKELAQRLGKSLPELKPPMGDILSDFFLHGLRYEEIAKSRGVAVGSVDVYLKRGLEAMRRIWGREENS
jgi:DNA-directed RNA polymerase specialized sigma24 family protein